MLIHYLWCEVREMLFEDIETSSNRIVCLTMVGMKIRGRIAQDATRHMDVMQRYPPSDLGLYAILGRDYLRTLFFHSATFTSFGLHFNAMDHHWQKRYSENGERIGRLTGTLIEATKATEFERAQKLEGHFHHHFRWSRFYAYAANSIRFRLKLGKPKNCLATGKEFELPAIVGLAMGLLMSRPSRVTLADCSSWRMLPKKNRRARRTDGRTPVLSAAGESKN